MLDNNLNVVDLSDLDADLPLDIVETKQILSLTEDWENSWNKTPLDSLGYPSIVKNDRGPNPDNKFYLYYAHHDIPSGIGCAVADDILGPYQKIVELDPDREDSRVLRHRDLQVYHHLSSPSVVWNPQAEIWYLYFHTYHNLWESGQGHQQTYLATCRDLATHQWDTLTNPDGTWKIVLPVSKENWMNSQSSYHNVCVLPPDGTFLAFLSGGGGKTDEKTGELVFPAEFGGMGFGTSPDGLEWTYFPENPIFKSGQAHKVGFIGYLGDGEYLVAWGKIDWGTGRKTVEDKQIFYGRTRDFKTIVPDPRGPARWISLDRNDVLSTWREGDQLYLFGGKHIHIMKLPVKNHS